MIEKIIICSIILIIAVISSKLLYRFGVPTLLIFLVLGMLFGSDGIVGIYFDNYELAREMCSIGLIFIMFYGGFGTNWKVAKPVLKQSILMASLGVLITAILTGIFSSYICKIPLLEGLLIGAVVSSTDAASVFSILRSRKLNLKDGIASLLEVESGSNDPSAYMITMVILTLMSKNSTGSLITLMLKQVLFGLVIGFVLSKIAVYTFKKINFEINGLYSIFAVAIALLSYALSEYIGGNGYLSVYVVGLFLGNSKIRHKKSLVHFFDGISWLMQIMLFFTLGLLAFPSKLPSVMFSGVAISLFLIFIARPVATFSILSFFKTPIKQQIFISWVGLRGAASIVFAIYTVTDGILLNTDIFHIIFFVALFSVSVQGTLIPILAKKLGLVDDESPVLKTFTDYEEETGTILLEMTIGIDHSWVGKTIMDADIPDDILVVMIKRNKDVIIPNGSTVIRLGDVLVLSGGNLSELSVQLN